MTDSQLHTLGRGWLESKGLSHLLPDPHSHAQIRCCVALHYPGGCKAFRADMAAQFGEFEVTPPLRPRPVVQPLAADVVTEIFRDFPQLELAVA